MEFFSRLLNRPPPKPAICDRPPTPRESASEAQQQSPGPLSREQAFAAEQNPAEAAAPASSSGPSSLAQESLSSASSFQSLASSLSSKSSSGICADSAPGSPDKTFDHSYVNVDIPDLDDLISACANINLNRPVPASGNDSPHSSASADLSQDQTFASAGDETISEETTQPGAHAEQSLQTFKTCPALEATQVQLVESSTSVEASSAQPPQADDRSSVIPYVSFEESVLRKHQTDEDSGVELKCPLASPARQRDACSPTPCVEIDVVEAAKACHVTLAAPPASHDQLDQVLADGSSNSTYASTPALNSTVVLDSLLEVQEPIATDANVPEKLNVTAPEVVKTPVSSPLPKKNQDVAENSKEVVIPTDFATEAVANIPIEGGVTVQEVKSLNGSADLACEFGNLNKTQEIVKEDGSIKFNETQDIVKEDSSIKLNKTQDIVNENVLVNATQDSLQATNNLNVTQEIVQEKNNLNSTQNIVQDKNILNKTEDIVQEGSDNSSQILSEENSLNKTAVLQELNKSFTVNEDNSQEKNNINKTAVLQDLNKSFTVNEDNNQEKNSINKTAVLQELNKSFTVNENNTQEKSSLNKSEVVQSKEEIFSEKQDVEKDPEFKVPLEETKEPKNIVTVKKDNNVILNQEVFTPEEEVLDAKLLLDPSIASTPLPVKVLKQEPKTPKSKGALFSPLSPRPQSPQFCAKTPNTPIKSEAIGYQLDDTVAINKSCERSSFTASELITKKSFDADNLAHVNSLNSIQPPPEHEYEAFKPQQQSTALPFTSSDLDALQEEALSIAKVINASLEKVEEDEVFVSATTELFEDPSAFDYLNRLGSQSSHRSERYDSLYMKFDPLAQRQSMLPQKNLPCASAVEEEEKQTKVDTPISSLDTPRKNPALAAIDRLLFYSPSPPTAPEREVPVKEEKKERPVEVEKQEPPVTPIVDEKMTKELELVRSTVVQLEAELEKQKRDREHLEKQKTNFEDKYNHVQMKLSQLQSQLTQEVKCKDQMTVVVEEYEKSISRLIAEGEKDRTNFEAERAKLQEELQVANQHLSNTEAAFSDVHSKYERLKNVVSAYKSNETVLKESIAENQETIKTLENRYEQLKSHAMAQLEKANLELTAIRKHNEAENIKLKALVRKAELKSKSLEETVEQKIKENKELTKIIDEMIARVD